MREELLKGLTKEQIEKVKACKNQEEMLLIAKNEGIELTDEQLEAINGGCGRTEGLLCPYCGQSDYTYQCTDFGYVKYTCNRCGNAFYQNYYSRDVVKNL